MQVPYGATYANIVSFNKDACADDEESTSASDSDAEEQKACQTQWNGSDVGAMMFYMGALSCMQDELLPQHGQSFSASPSFALSGFAPPPGLSAPPGLPLPRGLAPPPGLEMPQSVEDAGPKEFDPKAFRQELVSMLKELAQTKNVAAAVRRIRSQRVPVSRQARETTDILTRGAEELRGNPRRLYLAFAVGLARGDPSAFERKEVLVGIEAFFKDVYEDLCEEVPRLPSIVQLELIPTMREVFSAEEVDSVMPAGFQAV